MNTTDIEAALAADKFTSAINFAVLPSNHLPQETAIQRPVLLVINLSPCSHPGSHWLAVYLPKSGNGELFCSYGTSPEDYRKMNEHFDNFYRLNFASGCLYSDVQLQSLYSSYCGQYVTLFLLCRARNLSYVSFLKCFTSDVVVNDAIVCNWWLSYVKQ